MKKRSTEGGSPLEHNPFGALEGLTPEGRDPAPASEASRAPETPVRPVRRGRLDVRRERRAGGGGQVLVVSGPLLASLGETERKRLFKALKQACAAGGTCREDRIEIQGDTREKVLAALQAAGFQPVWSGG